MVARNKVVITGQLDSGVSSGSDIWTIGMHFGGDLLNSAGGIQTWANNIATFLTTTTGIPTLKSLLSNRGTIRSVNTYYYPATGPAGFSGAAVVAPIAGSGSPIRPAQCALVVTTLTGLAGRTHRGRLYWPALGLSFTSNTLSFSAGDATLVGNEIKALVAGIQAAAPTNAPVFAVYSAASDALTPVNALRVGNLCDTQRRRRNAMIEIYQTVSVP